MSRISSLSRRASPTLGPSRDENFPVTPSSRISRSGSRLAQHAKDLKSVWDGPASLSRRASGEDFLSKKRSPLSNTTNTLKSRASGLFNESAETELQVLRSNKDRRNLPASPTRHPSAKVGPTQQHYVSPAASSEGDDATLDVDMTQSPRPSSEGVRGSPPRRRAELHIDVEAANAIGPQSSSQVCHGRSGLDAPSAPEATDSQTLPSANKGTALGSKNAQQERATQPVRLGESSQSGDLNNQPSAENSLFSQAMTAVLQERLGITSLTQLPEAEAKALVHGELSSWVAQYLSQLAESYAVSPESLAGLDTIDDAQSPTPPLMLSPPPFPADALPSEIQLEQNTNLYLSGLSETMTDDHLLRLGTLYGDVISHKAIINSETGLCKGYGFVMYAKARDAAIAMVELQRQGFLTSFARHESFSAKLRSMADDRSTNVYVSNLPLDLDDQQLAALVQPHSIVSRRILSKPDGTSRGVGFIRFQTREIAQDCIDRLHGKRLRNHPHPLQARFADSETQKRLKQDATLRKVYADLDMGKLQTPAREGSSADARREDESDSNQAASQARPLPNAAERIIASSRAASGSEPEGNHLRGAGWKSPHLSSVMSTWGDGRVANSKNRLDSLGGASLWPSFNSSAGLGSRNVSPSLDPLYWRPTAVPSPGMSPSTSSGNITAMASMFPEASNSVSSPRQMPRPHHRLNDSRRELLPGVANHSHHGRGSGIPGSAAESLQYGWPGMAPRVSQGSERLSPLLGHQTPALVGQQGMEDVAGGQRMYSATSLEGLSGLEALRAAGFITASGGKAAIPIVDPTTRPSAYEMVHRARQGWQSHGGEAYRAPMSPPLHEIFSRNGDGSKAAMMPSSISLRELLRRTPSGRHCHQLDGVERESDYERRPGMSNSHSLPSRLESAAEGEIRGSFHEGQGRWESAGPSLGRREDVA